MGGVCLVVHSCSLPRINNRKIGMDGEECKTEILPDALVTRSWGWFIILQIPITMDFMHRTLCLFPRTAWDRIKTVK